MEKIDDFVIGRDVVLEEHDTVSDLLSSLPLKAQYGAKTLVEQVHKLRLNHSGVKGVKSLFSKVKETARENLRSVNIYYNCFDASHDFIVLGTNLGVIFLFDRIGKHLSRLVIESGLASITNVKLLASHSLVAGGHVDGKISIFSFILASQGYGKSDSIQITSAHSEAITCLEWSPDGSVLYSGDASGKIVMTVIKFGEEILQTALLFTEDSPAVQLSYSSVALLVSTQRRTVVWKYAGEEPIQVGQKERKIIGGFGACFYPPARQTEDSEDLSQIVAYVARPGLRLWTSNIDGLVSSTLMYKGLMNENPPTIKTLYSATSPFNKTAAGNQIYHFGRLLVFHGQFIVTWDSMQLWVLDTSPCSIVGCLSNHGPILDVCTVGHEIFLLTQSNERMIVKFSLIPKIPNPLIKIHVVADLAKESSTELKADNSMTLNLQTKQLDLLPTDFSYPALQIDTIADFGSSADNGDSVNSPKSLSEQENNALAPPLITRFESIPEKDYGDIVYSKSKKRNKKKKRKNDEKSQQSVVQGKVFPLLVHRVEPSTDEFSDVSSEFDSVERNELSPTLEQNSDQDTENAASGRLIVSSSEHEGIQDQLTVQPQPDDQAKGDFKVSAVDETRKDDAHDGLTLLTEPALPDTNETVSVLSTSSHLSTKKSSSPVNFDSKVHPATPLEDLVSPPYLAKSFSNVYSSAEVNLSDMSFSSKSFDKSSGAAKKLVYSPPIKPQTQCLSVVESVSVESSPLEPCETSDENSPLCLLESDGAEELADTSSWHSSGDGSVPRRTLSEIDAGTLLDSVDTQHQNDFMSDVSQQSLTDPQASTKPNLRLLADSWADYIGPNQSAVQYLTVSDTHLWCVTSNDSIFYCPTHFSVTSWTQLDGNARIITTNVSGDVIWCIDRKNYAYYRAGVSAKRLTGKEWCPVEKEMRFIAVDDSCVWGIKMNGDVFLRTDVSRQRPQGKGWQTIKLNTGFVQASCLDGIVWFLDKKNVIHVYKGIESVKPANQENWEMLSDICARWVCLDIEGVAFIVDPKGFLWFTTNVTHTNRTGGEWFQISLGQYLMQDTGTVLESLWSWVRPEIKAVAQAPKELIESLWSWVKHADEAKLVSASPKAGVWVQGSQGSMHAAHGHLLGSRWDPEVPAGVAQSVFWSYVSAGGFHSNGGQVWVVKPNGEMVCFQPGGRAVTVNPPTGSALKLLAVSARSVWGIKHNFKVVQRSGTSGLCPEGYRWTELNLSTFGIGKVLHLSCGALSTWAVDENGQVWLRIGREEDDSVATQAWLPVEGRPLSGCRFAKVAVSPQDTVVWAVDDRHNVYARNKITPTFPIGMSWIVVPGTGVKDICVSEHMVWAICPNGDIACRYGVSETNCVGDYWKKVPGNFELISVSPDDQLWAIDQNGQLFHRKTQPFFGTQAPLKPRSFSTLFPGEGDWEFI